MERGGNARRWCGSRGLCESHHVARGVLLNTNWQVNGRGGIFEGCHAGEWLSVKGEQGGAEEEAVQWAEEHTEEHTHLKGGFVGRPLAKALCEYTAG